MIDIHTHILPGVDDGSQSVEETVKMFEMLLEQGVDTVVATPHMYLDEDEIESFLKRRDEAVLKIQRYIGRDKRPALALGAEVQFIPELCAMDDVEKLCISGTRYILVEMPFSEWSGYTYKALTQLYTARGITPIIAHVDRYLDFQKENDEKVLMNLKDANALIQINSSFLTFKASRRRALSLVKKNLINFMGSDGHNISTRKPEFITGFDVIYDRFGEKGLESFEYWEDKIKDKITVF